MPLAPRIGRQEETELGEKYFFFDIDGTLTDRSTGQIVPSAAEAVRNLRKSASP